MTDAGLAELLDGTLDAIWLVDPKTLRITAVNPAAASLVGLPADTLVGMPAIALAVTPEDMFFWEDVAAGLAHAIHSNAMLRGADGDAVAVERKVSRIWLTPDTPCYLVALRDLRAEKAAEETLEHRVSELSATLESTGDGILVIDLQGQVRNFNQRFADLWALPGALHGSQAHGELAAYLQEQVLDQPAYEAAAQALALDDTVEQVDILRLRSGRILERRSVPQRSRNRVRGRVYSFRDVTQHLQSEGQLRLAAKVFDSSPEAVFITNAAFEVLQANPRCVALAGPASGQLLGTSARQLFHDPTRPQLFAEIEMALLAHGFWSGEVWRSMGETPVAVEVSWVALQDAQGQLSHTVGFFKDMTERLEAQRRIEKLAYRDVLTGLPNRLLLGQRVEFALRLAERGGGDFAILFIDLDRFKNINDSLGHAFGDRVLMEVADRILHCMRDVDTLSRMGGDEFVAFLQDADAMGAEVAARRILDALAQPFLVDEMNFSLGCSIGVAMYPADGRTLDDLIKCADTAMYRVKERGRGNFRFYQPQMNVDLLSRMKMDHAMRRAMESGLYGLHYQPQVALDDGRLLGAEALVRWTDPELGVVSPATFIPLAEESGFIITIGSWVMQEAVRQAAVWQRGGRPLVVSVNVSALQFQQPDFVERVAACIADAELNPALLELELTESILVQDANEALARLHALAGLGVSLAIDDFGTGYSSLAYLKKFPISKLKIDRTFVMGLPEDESDRAIVGATVAMARALKLSVVAEGVETQAQCDYLRELQCASFQGFLCSPGLPAAEFEVLVARLTPPPLPGALGF
ncbi:MAG: diguanylate cyclase [Curvibacter sp. RIFCSPHIGHO2_12_FULL_63_18]|uniref:sensor domain-containing protein n=1 Tax=Rhodoferax sp. TaxID=50421 RepID=UPI0008D52671|nr:EAL domain-containing protein [Rhodoferax sp.]OGO97011.1 MAG: diguanylate cyclase [Curvibacter sp. GWA2_63_95]OGP01188.1 MAG: diguanylate cyclase [Curvibacter sp. RIFCSPHIGHO2_12_FULL_63_18]HCX80005.1 diguanylate cyclase [Rhodoferax sp.]